MTRIEITKLPCGKYQVRSDSGIDHGHFADFAGANRKAHGIALNIRMAGRTSEILFGALASRSVGIAA